jgi:hypothetical protein
MLEGEVLFQFRRKTELQLASRTLQDIHGNSLGNVDPLRLDAIPRKGESAMRRWAATALVIFATILLTAAPALACGGLVAPNGTVNLIKTTTLAAYYEGVEHYVTSFEFVGGGAKFGSIVPLPGIPSDVRKGGRWTLQRLVQEVAPLEFQLSDTEGAATAVSRNKAVVILETSIEALDITVVKGGGDAVGEWAKEQGFSLSPDTPEVLDFYAERSPIFMAVRFDAKEARARGQARGDGTPVHLTIPTHDPWVPLRILGLGKQAEERIEADLFLLTPNRPHLLPAPDAPGIGLSLERSEPASKLLLSDLRSDRGMEWLPERGMWLSYLEIDASAGQLTHDLAIDASGVGAPSPVAAGLVPPLSNAVPGPPVSVWPWLAAMALGAGLLWGTNRMLRSTAVPRHPDNFRGPGAF